MNKIFPRSHLTGYETDYAQWCAEQGAALREGRLSDLDRENLAEEIESLGRSDRREIESRLTVLLLHLLKWRFQPSGRSGSWKSSVFEQRTRLAGLLRESPSLKSYPKSVLAEAYSVARLKASGETDLPEDALPADCPFTIAEILDAGFLPD